MFLQTKDMKKSTYPWLFSVIILVVLLLVALYLGYSGYFFSISMMNAPTDIQVGDTVQINLSPNETSVVSFTLDGAYLPGERIPQIIQLKADNLEKDLKVRVKAEIFSKNMVTDLDFVTTDFFTKGADNYFYYTDTLAGGNKTTFCSYLVIPEDSELLSKEKYVLSVVVENLDASLNVEQIWNMQENIENA